MLPKVCIIQGRIGGSRCGGRGGGRLPFISADDTTGSTPSRVLKLINHTSTILLLFHHVLDHFEIMGV